MDQNQPLFTFYIQRTIRENRSSLKNTETFYDDIMEGGHLLWKKYFLWAKYGQTLSSIVERLKQDLVKETDEMKQIRKYGKKFGFPLLVVKE